MKTSICALTRRPPRSSAPPSAPPSALLAPLALFALLAPLAMPALLLFCVAASARAQDVADPFPLTAEGLRSATDEAIGLSRAGWRYRPGDDGRRAAPDYDDAGWERLPRTGIDAKALPRDGWNGRGWFRLRVRVDDDLAGRPLALRMWQRGASEVYVDGKLIGGFGRIAADKDEEYNPRGLFVPTVFAAGEHTIAVRFSCLAAADLTRGRGAWLARADRTPYFSIDVADAADAVRDVDRRARADHLDYALAGVLGALALVHLLLYAFYPAERGNLFYCFFAAALAATELLSRAQFGGHYGSVTNVVLDVAQNMTQGLALVSLLAFLCVEFVGRVPRSVAIVVVLWAGVAVSLALQIRLSSFYSLVLWMLVATLGVCLFIVVRALVRRQPGAWIIGAGVAALAVGIANNVLASRGLTDPPEWARAASIYLTIMSVPLAVSLYLARNFARTNRSLAARLAEVEDLSARRLEQEQREAALRVEHERTRIENERRAQELEEARRLQLSMLPERVPDLPRLEVAAYMRPATEVGGDYYDFHTGADGTLTVVVGDATGHGLKAGTIVTATKGLFNAFADEPDVPTFFCRASRALKGMNLRGLYMALVMLKVRGAAVTLGAAGMPPVLVYRARTGAVDEVLVKGMPLGSIAGYAYKERRFDLAAGDVVVLMSDGYPERFDERGEMIGYDRARAVLAQAARATAAQIIDRFVREGDEWAGARRQDDDVTFVVLKLRE